mmetsp:Transcript_33473/g.78994  ORF Transcript_33473/g.78994 Transcript_33473/m.78994 type:complete len:95 (-) Transcript_33473:4-288(-)
MYLPVTATFAQWADSHEITCAFPFDSITIGQGRPRRRSEVTTLRSGRGRNLCFYYFSIGTDFESEERERERKQELESERDSKSERTAKLQAVPE